MSTLEHHLESGGHANSAVDMADKERGIIPLLESVGQAIELSCMTDGSVGRRRDKEKLSLESGS